MEGFENERRPIQGRGWAEPVPLLRDERPWIRWPLEICYRPPVYLAKCLFHLLLFLANILRTSLRIVYISMGGGGGYGRDAEGRDAPQLFQSLNSRQILFIAISVTLGSGAINNYAKTLEISGPGGALLAVGLVGLVAISVMEGVSELVQCFPAPNSIVEYIRTFVDEDLGWVAGICYWYTFCALFAIQHLSAASLVSYWGLQQTLIIIVFYIIIPVIMLWFNLLSVSIFGVIEVAGGICTICFIIGCSIFMYAVAGRPQLEPIDRPITDGFTNNISFASSKFAALCYAIPLVAFSFIGIESVTVTAFESRLSTGVRRPSQTIAYVILILYFIYTLGQVLNVKWTNANLPLRYSSVGSSFYSPNFENPKSTNLVVIATWQANFHHLAGFFNGCLIFILLMSSNTCLYIASRTLYGLARDIPDYTGIGRLMNRPGRLVRPNGVPILAVMISELSFIWLPFLQSRAATTQDFLEIVAFSASISCLIVWALLSLAFIRYEKWLRMFTDSQFPNQELAGQVLRKSRNYKARTALGWAQPLPAYVGLVGSLMIIIFTTAMWWSTPATFTKVAMALGAPIFASITFIIFKIVNRRWWIRLDADVEILNLALGRLRWLKQDELPAAEEMEVFRDDGRAVLRSLPQSSSESVAIAQSGSELGLIREGDAPLHSDSLGTGQVHQP